MWPFLEIAHLKPVFQNVRLRESSCSLWPFYILIPLSSCSLNGEGWKEFEQGSGTSFQCLTSSYICLIIYFRRIHQFKRVYLFQTCITMETQKDHGLCTVLVSLSFCIELHRGNFQLSLFYNILRGDSTKMSN